MRLYASKASTIATEVVRTLVAQKDIEVEDAGAQGEVVKDVESVLKSYLDTEKIVDDKTRDLLQRTNRGPSEFQKVRQQIAEHHGIKVGDETLDHLLDQVVQMLMHSHNVEEVFAEDIEDVRLQYAHLEIPAELMTYIEDMADKLADAHLFIGRAGASTIAELTAAGRPAILIPFPSATDDHQTSNAREMTKAGGARTIQQTGFTPEVLARQIEAMAADPVALNNAAARALSVGRPHAARDLADLVERVGNGVAPVIVGPALTPRVGAEAPVGGVPA